MKEKIKKFFKKLGPGFVTGAADVEPSGIGTYSYSGSKFNLGQIWTAWFTLPFMIAIQEVCARIGMVTGKGLAGVIRQNYSKKLLYFCVTILIVANVVNIGADIGAMASAVMMFLPLPFAFLAVLITLVILILEFSIPYKKYARLLQFLALSLLTYWVTAFLIKNDWGTIANNFILPEFHLSFEYVFLLVAIFGTNIAPYLFFWQASGEVEEEVAIGRTSLKKRRGASFEEIKNMRLDVALGMIFANVTMFFIILTTAGTLFAHGIHNIETAEQAAAALKPLAGDWAHLFFALGIIGTGMLAIPILAGSASYAFTEALKMKGGLYLKIKQAWGFYGMIAVAMLLGLLFNFSGINPIRALLYTSVLNGIIAVPLLFVIMRVGNNRRIMGEFRNGKWSNLFGWLTTGVMAIAVIFLIISLFFR